MKIWKQTGWLVFVFFTVILAYQWHAAGKGGAKPEQELQITIEAERQIAVVTYQYPVLSPGVYEIDFPPGAGDVSCAYEEDGCRLVDGQQLNLEETASVHLTYTVKIPENKQWDNWHLVVHKNGSPVQSSFTLKILDAAGSERNWAAPVRKPADIELDRIHFHRFKFGKEYPLYVTRGMEEWTYEDSTVLLSDKNNWLEEDRESFKEILDLYGPAVVRTGTKSLKVEDGYWQVPGKDDDALRMELLKRKLTSLSSEQDGNTIERAVGLIGAENRDGLSKAARDLLEQKIVRSEAPADLASFLDRSLYEITGMKTSYFRKGEKELYFVLKHEPVPAVVYQGEPYYSVKELAQQRGYSLVSVGKGQIRILTPDGEYVFYENEPIFIFNEEDFGIAEGALKQFGETFYMKKRYVDDLFGAFQKK